MKKKMNLFSSKKQKFTQKIVDGLMNKKCSKILVKFEMDGLSMPVGGSNHSTVIFNQSERSKSDRLNRIRAQKNL